MVANRGLMARILVAAAAVLALVSCTGPEDVGDGTGLEGNLIIFHAGSLTVPVAELTDAFSELHPGVTFETESAVSRTTARKVSELGREADIVIPTVNEKRKQPVPTIHIFNALCSGIQVIKTSLKF